MPWEKWGGCLIEDASCQRYRVLIAWRWDDAPNADDGQLLGLEAPDSGGFTGCLASVPCTPGSMPRTLPRLSEPSFSRSTAGTWAHAVVHLLLRLTRTAADS